MKKTLLLLGILGIGVMIVYALSYLQPKQLPLPSQTNKEVVNEDKVIKEVVNENKFLMENYFPIKKGSFWEYKGTKKELVEGKIETSVINKRIEVKDITTDSEISMITVTNDGQNEKWSVEGNTIDFEPYESYDKFVLTFPLYIGQKWGDEIQLKNRKDGYYVWEVEEKIPQDVLGKKYDDCFRIAFKILSSTEYRIFCYGVGTIEVGFHHNGALNEENYKLTAYQ